LYAQHGRWLMGESPIQRLIAPDNNLHFGMFNSGPPCNSFNQEALETAMAMLIEMNTASPDGHLREIMKEQGVSLTAKEVQYDMVNNLDKEFGI
jgi:hypothetical protein